MRFVNELIKIYTHHRIPRAAAALSYYLTMTFFPLIVVLYTLFGRSYATALRVLDYFDEFLTADAAEMIRNYLYHVARSGGKPILIASVTLLITSSSAAVRVLRDTIGEMQGGQRYPGWADFLISFLLALVLLLAMYFSIAVMFTGHDFLALLRQHFPDIAIGITWSRIRYLLLAAIVLLLLWGAYTVSRSTKYRTWPGALLSTAALVVMSWIFSAFIAASAHYSLVYGSLASLILLMFWLFLNCQMIFLGAVLNVALRDFRAPKGEN